MPKIAILADIHGNLFALDAVIEDISSANVDEVLVAGDLVGRGPQGSAVIDRVREIGWPSVRGNHEDYLINFARGRTPAAWRGLEEWDASRWMANELAEDHVAYIEALPFHMQSAVAPDLLVYHGTPDSNQEGLGTWTPIERLEEIASMVTCSLFVTAHTHRPLLASVANVTFVNVGSVGLPFNGNWHAQYAILSRDEGSADWEVDFRSVPWDRDGFLDVYESSGFLAEGTITSTLLRSEVLTARPHLVPFMKWAAHLERTPCLAELDAFLEFYDPNLSMRELFDLLQTWDERE